MNETLRFRGPDAEGIHVDCGTGLGHRRLSVIDLSGGAQPMADPSGKVAVTFNGEIYNFRELRDELQSGRLSVPDRPRTPKCSCWDTCTGVKRSSSDCWDMFAFGIWDRDKEMLLLARDRLGVKPLYWAATLRGDIVFGSDCYRRVGQRNGPASLGPRGSSSLYTHGYVLGNDSILDGIRRLPPANVLRWRRGREPVIRSYWNMAERWAALSAEAGSTKRQGETGRQFIPLLERAVLDRLISDVPLGALLSGGIDSTVVVALIRRNRPQLRTFSIGFSESSFDETPWSRLAAAELRTQHHEEVARCDSPDLLLHVARPGRALRRYLDPAHARALPHGAGPRDGGPLRRRRRRVVGGLHHAQRRPVSSLGGPRAAVGGPCPAGRTGPACPKTAANSACSSRPSSFWPARTWTLATPTPGGECFAITSSSGGCWATPRDCRPTWPSSPSAAAYAEAERLSPLDRMLYVDYKTYLVDDILVKVDRASMAYGLEVRSPLLDHRLVELCARMPARVETAAAINASSFSARRPRA